MRRDNLNTLKYFFKLTNKISKTYMVKTLVASIFKAARPFLNIVIPKFIIDELLGQKRIDQLILYVGMLTIGNLLLNIINNYFVKLMEEEGIEFSGGQAQKIAIARALYKDSPIVILDEPTSALDPISEYEVYNSFNKLVEGKTAIYISHRLSSTRFSDVIAVFKDGEIIQYGNHYDLLKEEDSLYANMFNTQAQYYIA